MNFWCFLDPNKRLSSTWTLIYEQCVQAFSFDNQVDHRLFQSPSSCLSENDVVNFRGIK